MKGINVIELNTATVMEAVQEYLDRRMVTNKSPVVTNVLANGGATVSTLRVVLKEREADATAKRTQS